MAIYGYTKNYKLIKPQFNTDTWHDYIYDNLDTIDAVMSAIYASGNWKGFWATNTVYTVGDVIIDQSTDTMYKVMVDHTTSEATFAEEFATHPTYYELWSPNNLAESWAIKMDDVVSNTDYSSKAYAISSGLIDSGSAQEWAIKSGTVGTTGEYSAKKYATDAHDDYISMTTDVNVIAVGTNIANVNAVGQSISSVNTVASDISSVNTVAGISTDVTTVASIATAVSNVSGIESEVLDVSDNRTDISTVALNVGDVNTVADISTDVSTVADNDANVTTVATNIADVNNAATHMADIQAAPTAASNAAASATLAQEWASKMDGQVASTDYSSKYYAGQAATDASNSNIWAEGTDEQVQALGGVHSSKVWAEQSTNANIALTNSPYTTNRILEIPQDIKLELNNGTLTLKAGSKVYVPNGFESDGVTPKFDIVTIDTDKTTTDAAQRTLIIGINTHGDIQFALEGETGSPAVSTYKYYYDSNANKCYVSTTGIYYQSSFPLCIATSGSSGFTSIDQVFNGFGYIGSTVFALPGVKCQCANGRNKDGTYITTIYTVTSVLTHTQTSSSAGKIITEFMYSPDGLGGNTVDNVKYNSDENYMYSGSTAFTGIALFDITLDANVKITKFEPKTVDSVANSNASNLSQAGKSYLSGLGYPSDSYIDVTVLASDSNYTAPANGWFNTRWNSNSSTLHFIQFRDGANTHIKEIRYYSTSVGSVAVISTYVRKGQQIKMRYDGASSECEYFRFYYAEGETNV